MVERTEGFLVGWTNWISDHMHVHNQLNRVRQDKNTKYELVAFLPKNLNMLMGVEENV